MVMKVVLEKVLPFLLFYRLCYLIILKILLYDYDNKIKDNKDKTWINKNDLITYVRVVKNNSGWAYITEELIRL